MIRSAGGGAAEVRLTKLCDLLQMRQTAVTELVKRSEDAGLIERQRSGEDGRVWLLALTAEGEHRLLHAFRALRNDRAALTNAFRQMTARFEAARK
jgi:DNA-binding MarR family transcriptional regulator